MPTVIPTDRDERRIHALAESLRRAIADGRTDEEIVTLARAVLDVDRHEDLPSRAEDVPESGPELCESSPPSQLRIFVQPRVRRVKVTVTHR
jgi:hypothetical protein